MRAHDELRVWQHTRPSGIFLPREVVSDVVVWNPPTLDMEVRMDLNAIFAGQ